MALHADPNIFQITQICANEQSANEFAITNGLLPNIPGVGRSHMACCTKCKSMILLKKAGAIFGSQGNQTWFARMDVINGPSVKLWTDKVLMINWLWAEKIGTKQCHEMLGDFTGMRKDHALTYWHHYIHELLLDAMNQAPPMGGPNEIVEIDDSFFAGQPKPAANMHERMLRGNHVGPARRNYGNGELSKKPGGGAGYNEHPDPDPLLPSIFFGPGPDISNFEYPDRIFLQLKNVGYQIILYEQQFLNQFSFQSIKQRIIDDSGTAEQLLIWNAGWWSGQKSMCNAAAND
uniref:Uncharacterized protein n=1 Tax=Romanomermis culicivorax TaxID=13658 RepID=A0A915JFI2_ROMCU